ncbi:PREDICTED: bZIP transcription factor 53 [Nelumbo nucifera]|uniref:BZIP transcription factor 53 n=2 Tax=Nelumbo nucifera TaxID=4432 RepID=A0A1U8Q704_NELNU|nr:PREDICTED: bZIP transcription factor 53 [Nelumbo nucifera]DAD33128.1 TPA_asm: hypothetical protein HUJ06_011979 [Nelumbo nucifera]
MSTVKQNVSSGSEGDPKSVLIDDRKRKRMLSNRESARRSRARKQQHLEDLTKQVSQLQKDNNEITQRINAITQLYLQISSQNNILRAQEMELEDRLNSLKSVIRECQSFCPEALDAKPWSLPFQSVPIIAAAADMFSY